MKLSHRSLCFLLCAFFASAQSVVAQSESVLHPQLQRFADTITNSKTESVEDVKNDLFDMLVFEFVRTGQVDVVNSLVSRNVSLGEIRDHNGNSLLHVAATNGHQELVSLLVAQSVPVDLLNKDGRSALFNAANQNRIATAKILLNAGANPNSETEQQPINAAAWYGHTEVLSMLLKAGALTTSRDSDGNTPLHKSVWQSNYKCVRLLVESGANVQEKNDAGQTPQSMAVDRAENAKDSELAKRPWGTEQLIGEPDAGNDYSQLEWCPATESGGAEWIELTYDEAVVPSKIEIYAKPTPVTVTKVSVFDDEGAEYEAWSASSGYSQADNRAKHVGELQLKLKSEFKTERIKVYVDRSKDPGWIYYDAVGLIDLQGNKQWAAWAKSSSTYASAPAPDRPDQK